MLPTRISCITKATPALGMHPAWTTPCQDMSSYKEEFLLCRYSLPRILVSAAAIQSSAEMHSTTPKKVLSRLKHIGAFIRSPSLSKKRSYDDLRTLLASQPRKRVSYSVFSSTTAIDVDLEYPPAVMDPNNHAHNDSQTILPPKPSSARPILPSNGSLSSSQLRRSMRCEDLRKTSQSSATESFRPTTPPMKTRFPSGTSTGDGYSMVSEDRDSKVETAVNQTPSSILQYGRRKVMLTPRQRPIPISPTKARIIRIVGHRRRSTWAHHERL